ncbi:hypothetical protein QFW77_03080 [Luteimonas sp. RD2P54]|uniref:XAC0095-like domain-containing protein n=1 Tax=Luteimonas endophytica TaxID=3042023 RepID=A0ABT6J602_9GAMM|nr:hypothetical protein [Luteimonas endophytica]MDH5821977.1 hypothetical protein [Luteimonas endophytica]
MSNREPNDPGMTGYFLPEDSHFRLKKLHEHMVFLSQLAQPRTDDEESTGWGPQISGGELAVCLEQLADQAERVLDEVTWPAKQGARRKPSHASDAAEAPEDSAQTVEAADAGAADAEAADAGAEDEAAGEEAAVAAEANAEDRLVFGMTMDQLDTLNRRHDRLHAYGDLLFGVERIDLADGTLTMLGDAIFEEAEAASDLMDKVASQYLPDRPGPRNRVREEPAAYGASTASPGADRAQRPALPLAAPGRAGYLPQPCAQRLH